MKLSIALTALALLSVGTLGEEFYFWKLGHMDGPHTSSKALGISRDGHTAVGTTMVVDFPRAWRCDIDWTISTTDAPPLYNELFVQEDLGVIRPSFPSAAYASSDMDLSPDETCTNYDREELSLDWCGSTVVGFCDSKRVSYAVQWLLPVLDSVDEGDFTEVADFGGGLAQIRAMDVSADGSIMVGYGHNRRGPVGFWAHMIDPLLPVVKTLTIQDVITGQQFQASKAMAVSEDGYTIAGYGSLKSGNRAFVATVDDGETDPITLTSTILPVIGGGGYAEAYAMTPDGLYIAGRSDSPKGPQACIWFTDATTGEWVVKGLGALSQQNVESMATGIAVRPESSVGELIVVGQSRTNLYASEAFVWTGNPTLEEDEIGYFYDLEYILTKTEVGEISGMGSDWVLTEATGISANGDRIVGWGINPEGGEEAFVVTGYPYNDLIFTHE